MRSGERAKSRKAQDRKSDRTLGRKTREEIIIEKRDPTNSSELPDSGGEEGWGEETSRSPASHRLSTQSRFCQLKCVLKTFIGPFVRCCVEGKIGRKVAHCFV